MRLGIFDGLFPAADVGEAFRAVRAAGFTVTQHDLPAVVDDTVMDAIAAASRDTGVVVEALFGTYNMIHPDPAVRASGLARLAVVIAAAARLGVPMVTLCTGTRDAQDQWRGHPDNTTQEAWRDLCREMSAAALLAERHGVDLGIEPEQANVIRGARDALRFFRDVGCSRLRIVLDPANLFEQADRAEAARIVAEAVELLAGRIGLAHAKDRDAAGRFVTAGTGVVDFPDFLRGLHQAGFDGAVVAHGLSLAEAPGVSAFLHDCLPR